MTTRSAQRAVRGKSRRRVGHRAGLSTRIAVLCGASLVLAFTTPSSAGQIMLQASWSPDDVGFGIEHLFAGTTQVSLSIDPDRVTLAPDPADPGVRLLGELVRELMFQDGESASAGSPSSLTRLLTAELVELVEWDFTPSDRPDLARDWDEVNPCQGSGWSKLSQRNCSLVIEAQTAQAERSDFQL
jgi:hypothetical protein